MMSKSGISDVRLRWTHLTNGTVSQTKKGSEHFPAYATLMEGLTAAEPTPHAVLIRLPDEDTVLEIREWVEEHAKAQYRIFGRYEWTDYGVRVTRDVKGLVFHFEDEDMAIFFKLRWATGL